MALPRAARSRPRSPSETCAGVVDLGERARPGPGRRSCVGLVAEHPEGEQHDVDVAVGEERRAPAGRGRRCRSRRRRDLRTSSAPACTSRSAATSSCGGVAAGEHRLAARRPRTSVGHVRARSRDVPPSTSERLRRRRGRPSQREPPGQVGRRARRRCGSTPVAAPRATRRAAGTAPAAARAAAGSPWRGRRGRRPRRRPRRGRRADRRARPAEAGTSRASVQPGRGNDSGPGSAGAEPLEHGEEGRHPATADPAQHLAHGLAVVGHDALVLHEAARAVEPVPVAHAVERVEERPERHQLAVAAARGACGTTPR